MPVDMAELGRDSVTGGLHGAEQASLYALATYRYSPAHAFTLGARLEHQNDRFFKLNATPLVVRAGYVGTFEPVTLKALFGEGMVTPSPYELSRASSHLENPRSRSVEANGTVTLGPVSVTAAVWRVVYSDPVVFDTSGADAVSYNADGISAIGLDAAARMLLKPFQFWLFYSRYFQAEQRVHAADAWTRIGDLARDKLWAGATYDQSRFSATVLGRFVGGRPTVPSNPLGHMPGYVSLDAHVLVKNVLFEGATLGLRCMNLLDAKYSHPGIGAADSGQMPGQFAADGSYTGSGGNLNSALPQPRRSFYLTLTLDL
jgi:hypothetical protein